MAGKKILPDVPTLLRHKEKGMTDREVADLYGVSRQAVTLKLKGARESRMYRRDWPWEVQSRHKRGWLYEALSAWMVARHKERPLDRRETQRMTALLDMLDSLPGEYVVDYYPDEAIGFRVRPRLEDDDPDSLLGRTPEGARP